MSEIRYATKRRITAVWTVSYSHNGDGTVTIHGFSRDCDRGYADEKKLDRCALIEDGSPKRIVTGLVLQPYDKARYGWAESGAEGAVAYRVSNQQNVFSYGEPR